MFAVKESIMNGTVTMNTIVSLIDKPTFEEAKEYFKEKFGDEMLIQYEDIDTLKYVVKENEIFGVYGILENKKITIL